MILYVNANRKPSREMFSEPPRMASEAGLHTILFCWNEKKIVFYEIPHTVRTINSDMYSEVAEQIKRRNQNVQIFVRAFSLIIMLHHTGASLRCFYARSIIARP